jgi:hypothetical protein
VDVHSLRAYYGRAASCSAIERIVKAVEPFEYERVYGAFWDVVIEKDGKAVVKESAERYLRAIGQ